MSWRIPVFGALLPALFLLLMLAGMGMLRGGFGSEDLQLLRLFATQAAIAVENARLFTAARHREQYFQALVQNNPVAIVTMDLDFNITACNPAFEDLFGWTEVEVLGENLDELVNTSESVAQAATYTMYRDPGCGCFVPSIEN